MWAAAVVDDSLRWLDLHDIPVSDTAADHLLLGIIIVEQEEVCWKSSFSYGIWAELRIFVFKTCLLI